MAMRPWGGIEWEGGSDAKLRATLKRLATAAPALAGAALRAEAVNVRDEAAAGAPYDEANKRNPAHLRETGRVVGPINAEHGIEVLVVFGGADHDVLYAIAQHQSYFQHPGGGDRLFLLNAVELEQHYIASRVAARMQRGFEDVARDSATPSAGGGGNF